MKTCNDPHDPVTLWLFHPLTGKLAEDIDEELKAMTFMKRQKAKKEFVKTKKAGGLFYWMCRDGEWGRVELANFTFAALACGQKVTIEHNFPDGTDRLAWIKKRAGLA